MTARWSGGSIGPSWSGLRAAATEDPRDTSEALAELASWLPDDALRAASWAAELESRWNPHIENPIGAVGIFQFLPSTAKLLGTDASTIRGQGRADQARWLAKLWARRAPRARDLYLRLFYPAAEIRPDGHVIAEVNSKIWQQNPGLRSRHDGPITAGRVREIGTPAKDWPSGADLRAWAQKGHAPKGEGGGELAGAGLVILVMGAAWYLSQTEGGRRLVRRF